ncbi:MAG: hypothetical protein EOO73_31870 [Myxococcales bacterium]|nr:MAG: hypothetical protein EOO73_31870 [Myxococcales bacterium]
MSVKATQSYRRALRAYELGRLRSAFEKALAVTLLLALLGWLTTGAASLRWLPLALGVWVLAHWVGQSFQRGAFYGLLGGVVTQCLPMSILRPCCDMNAMPGADCCTMPGACLLAGAGVGVALAAVVPFGRASWWQTAAGMAAGLTSVAVLKCATLFTGEAIGLVAGLVGGLLLASAARSRLASATS